MDIFTTPQISKLFNVSDQTVKAWAREFISYLSPSAAPEAGRKRRFTPADLEVFALVAEGRHKGQHFESVHAALQAGQRGQIPALANELAIINPSTMIVTLRNQVGLLQDELAKLREEKSREAGKNDLLSQQLESAQVEIKALNREIGRLQAAQDADE